ncbi:MAG: phosphoenolpyruvate--protein phosphotransferase [Victivallales bacterium]|nr:phosphoenolpyruvate--protein phosphotransferase [Victivallales bacterium]
MKSSKDEIKIKGIAASPGIAIGTALVIGTRLAHAEKRKISAEEVEKEINKLEAALNKTKEQIKIIQTEVHSKLMDDEAHIFDAHLLIIDDHTLINSVKELIKKEKVNADYAFHKKTQHYISTINKIKDSYISERASDIKDVASRVIANINNQEIETLKHLPGQRIIITQEITPSDTISMDKDNVQAFATESGSRTSHAAIMARSMKIPAAVALKSMTHYVNSGDVIIVDGYTGTIVINPTPGSLNAYIQKEAYEGNLIKNLISESSLRPETIDGFRFQLAANIEFLSDVEDAKKYCAAGIGLYRTEYLYINSKTLPNENEQVENYKTVAKHFKEKHVIIRTVDLGGDKLKDILNLQPEDNPFLGYRAIRLCLGFPPLFQTQLRALLRASIYKNVKIMFPMICSVSEVVKALELLEAAKEELKEKDIPFDKNIEVGIMLETPSAAIIADKLAPYVDFFSIGTNDLIQYTLAVDRNSEKVAYLYQPAHPAILRLLKNITETAKKHNIWISLCGEMASDPIYTVFLVGLGIHELSMSPISMGAVRRIIRKMKLYEAEDIMEKSLKCSTADETIKLSLNYLRKIDPDILNLTSIGDL